MFRRILIVDIMVLIMVISILINSVFAKDFFLATRPGIIISSETGRVLYHFSAGEKFEASHNKNKPGFFGVFCPGLRGAPVQEGLVKDSLGHLLIEQTTN